MVLLFDRCNDLLKTRDDSLSSLSTRLSAIRVLGTMYEKLGRMTGRSFEETVGLLNKGWKNAESTTRAETMLALGKSAFLSTRPSTLLTHLAFFRKNLHWFGERRFSHAS